MAQEEDLALQEALRRSLEQTNLQESQLADALAESVRTHDHEIAREMQRDQLSQIEHDLMSQTRPNREETSRNIEAELLARETPARSKEAEWQVVGKQNLNRPRYIPLNFHKTGKTDGSGPSDHPVEHRRNISNCEQPTNPPVSLSHSTDGPSSPLRRQMPYRPPNLHSAAPSSTSANGLTTLTTSTTPTGRAEDRCELASIPILQYGPCVMHQAGIKQPGGSRYTGNEPLVVIDGQNVGCSYGAGGVSRFRAKGVEVVLDFYFNQGIPAVAMLPRNKVDTRSNISNERVADDPELLKKLEDQGRLAFTPAGAHDDHFLLSYAMNKGIDLVSNDRFQKEVAEQETHTDARKLRDFLNEHLIPYTFVRGEFIPNPKQSQLGKSIHHSRARS